MKSKRGLTGVELLLGVAILGAVAVVSTKTLPIFNGESRRAKEGQITTARLNDAAEAPAAANTASAQVIGQAAARLPDSPAASFIRNEVPIMLARGPVPDANELLAAEKRLNAYLSGQLDEARKLHGKALDQAGDLRVELAEAQAAKRASDDAISIAAAENVAANRAAIGFGTVCFVLIVAFFWLKSNSLPFTKLGELHARLIRGEDSLEQALDAVVDSAHWGKVAKATSQHFTHKDFKK